MKELFRLCNVNLQKMEDPMGIISNFSETKYAKDVSISLSTDAKKKLEIILTTGKITADTQILYLNELIFSKEDEDFLTEGQSAFIKKGNTISLLAHPRVLPHFKAVLNALVPQKNASNVMSVVEITLQGFSIDTSHSRRVIYDDMIGYENVQLTIYPGKHSMRILGD